MKYNWTFDCAQAVLESSCPFTIPGVNWTETPTKLDTYQYKYINQTYRYTDTNPSFVPRLVPVST